MKFITNVNGNYLREIHENIKPEMVEELRFAVAYGSDSPPVLEWAWKNDIPLRYWCRYDHTVPVSTAILKKFLERKSFKYRCFLAPNFFHAKIIWFVGHGVYIGSHNLTDRAWNKNIEAGCFFTQSEIIRDSMDKELEDFFSYVNSKSTELNQAAYEYLENIEKKANSNFKNDQKNEDDFNEKSPIHIFNPEVLITKKNALDRKKDNFLKSWNNVLGIMEKIGALVAKKENFPKWVPESTHGWVVVDQFLHDYYYRVVKDPDHANRFRVDEFYEKNSKRIESALNDAVTDWKNLKEANAGEDHFIINRASKIYEYLQKDKILKLTEEEFVELCESYHSFWEIARYVEAEEIGLPRGKKYSMEEKAPLLAQKFYYDRSANNKSIQEILYYILHDGSIDQTPHRYFEALHNSDYHIPLFGKASFGELIGWGLPHVYPPVNGRTIKALRSLGHDV